MSTATVANRLLREPSSTFTTRRFDRLIGRYYSAALSLSSAEFTTNALSQRQYLHPIMFWVGLGAVLASVAAMAIGNWFSDSGRRWYVFHALAILANIAIWPMMVLPGNPLPEGYTPFVWWMLGYGALSAGLGLAPILAAAYIVGVPIWFGILQSSSIGGHATEGQALQNAVYTFLISAVLASLVSLLRYRAKQQDEAAGLAAEAAAEAAAEQAVSLERLRLATVIHNQVLSALNSAANAHSPNQHATAVSLAEAALTRLDGYEAEVAARGDKLSATAFFSALTELISAQDRRFAVSTSVEGNLELPRELATALTEATLQAVTNSTMHAPNASQRKVGLRATSKGLKVTVVDDGPGFRPSRVPKNRMGLRTVIFRRVEQAGGVAHVNSKPGEGTTVILEWSVHD